MVGERKSIGARKFGGQWSGNRPSTTGASGSVLVKRQTREALDSRGGCYPVQDSPFREAGRTTVGLMTNPDLSAHDDQPRFDASAEHHRRPRLRPVRGFPVRIGDSQQVCLGLADARQISDRVVALPMAATELLPLLDGQRTVEEIVAQFGRGLTEEVLQGIVARLDHAGLLHGPRFEAMLARLRAEYDALPVLPPASTAAFADALVHQKHGADVSDEDKARHGPVLLRETMDQWMDKAGEDDRAPPLETLPQAIIAPHLDYHRGWLNYATVWRRLRGLDAPDRVVILGTNHFGMGTGVVACDKGYQTPLGTCPVDEELIQALRRRLGPEQAARLFEHRYDHEREHSIELQVPWIQHCLGGQGRACRVFGVLVHDPTVNNGESYDGQGLGLAPFVEAVRLALEDVGGRTLIVASADLSHVGPMFGDPHPLGGEDAQAAEARNRVMAHDQEMLGLIAQGRPEELVAAMAWQRNPTRWCSIGNIVAAMRVVQPRQVLLLRYLAAMDQQGLSMVTCVSGVMMG